MVLQEFLISSIVAILVLIAIRIYEASIGRSDKNVKLEPLPGPVNFPFIGSLVQIGLITHMGGGELFEQYHNICSRYGRVMGARAGNFNFAICEDYATTREILHSPDWTTRFPPAVHFREHTYSKNLGLVFSYGEVWKEMRKFSIRTLCEFGFGELNTAEQYLTEEVGCFMEHFEKLRLNSNNSLQMNAQFKIPMVNIIWRIVMGVRLDYGDEEALKIIHLVEKATEIDFKLHPFFAFPWLKYIGINPVEGFVRSILEMHNYLKKILDHRRNTGTATGSQSQTNFLDRLIQTVELERHNAGTVYTDEQLLSVLGDILGASLDTTGNSFEFAFLYMIKYPEVQRKVQEELDRVIGRNRMPDVFDRANLPYTEATMLETLRHANVVPLMLRTSTCDTVLNGYHVPKNTFCALNFTEVHMDEEIWGDPKAFRPERFLNGNGRIIKDNKLLAFGGGKRLCIGHTLAKVTWMAFFSALLQKYTFEASAEFPDVPTRPISGFTNTARTFYSYVKLR